jgi:nitrate/nitrite-specific signal transduction histidine kinase
MKDDRSNLFHRGEEFVNVLRRGAEFTKEVLQENERLRRRLAELEEQQQSAARDPHEWAKLRVELLSRINRLEEENRTFRERLSEVEEDNRRFADRYVEIEEENNNLANLYVASYQLHSTLDIDEVVKIVIEIVINLIGAEVFGIYLLDDRDQHLKVVAAEGVDRTQLPSCLLGSGELGRAVAAGETMCGDTTRSDDYARPIVVIPLHVGKRPIGAIALYSLLQQKDGFSALDHELFNVLGGHAATALFASRLYSQSERKLNTIQGFLDLLAQ